MEPYAVLGYTVDGDTYCLDCVNMRYAIDASKLVNCDPDGICPIFADSEWDYPVHCADCGKPLGARLTSEGKRYAEELKHG